MAFRRLARRFIIGWNVLVLPIAIVLVVRGHGCTVVNETHLDWGPGDIFIVPNWSWHAHENAAASLGVLSSEASSITTTAADGTTW